MSKKSVSPTVWMLGLALAGVALGVALFGGGRAGDDTPPPPKDVVVQEGTYALLVGCTVYPNLKHVLPAWKYEGKVRLIGPANDVEALRLTLHAYLGVPNEHITVLSAWPDDEAARPTRANILGQLERLATVVHAGDRVIFHYSGHGSQIRDTGGDRDPEPDGMDEILVCADAKTWGRSRTGRPNCITDDELRERLHAIRATGATVWASLDCCHAGTMTRGLGARVRGLDADLFDDVEGTPETGAQPDPKSEPLPETPTTRGFARADTPGQALADATGGIVAFYAVQGAERAPEEVLPRNPDAAHRAWQGVYSYLLVRTLQHFGGALTFAELQEHLLAAYASLPCDAVSPFAEGDLDMRVAGKEHARSPRLTVRVQAGRLVVDAGSLRGVSKGAELEVFKPGRLGIEAGRLGTLAVVAGDLMESTCRVVGSGPLERLKGLPARMPARLTRVGEQRFRLALAVTDHAGRPLANDARPAALQTFLDKPDNAARVRIVAPAEADWALRVSPTWLQLERMEPGADTPVFDTTPNGLGDDLLRVFRAQNLRRLAQGERVAALPEKLEVALLRNGAEMVRGDVFHPGDGFGVRIRNRTGKDQSVTVLGIDPAYGVYVVWPPKDETPLITAAEGKPIESETLIMPDDEFGTECLLVLAAPLREGTAPADFRALAGASLTPSRAVGSAVSLGDTIRDLTYGMAGNRGMPPDPTVLATKLITWQRRWPSVGVPPAARKRAVETPVETRGLAPWGDASGDDAPPSPWFVGQHAVRMPGEAGDEGVADAFVTWTDAVTQVYVDTEGDARLGAGTVADVARRAAAGSLTVGLVLRIEPSGRTAWYRPAGTGEPGRLALVLVDDDADREADIAYERVGSAWQRRPSHATWLTTRHLGEGLWDAGGRRLRAIHCLARLRKD